MEEKNQSSEESISYIIMELLLGLILLLIGAFIFGWKMVGSRGWEITEGILAQIAGIVLIIYGLYSIASAIKKYRLNLKDKGKE